MVAAFLGRPRSSLLRCLTTGIPWVRQMNAMMLSHTLLYLSMVLPVCCALNGFSLLLLPTSRRLMYIMAGMPTTLDVDACCARHTTMRAAQHISVNARSLGVGCCAMVNNHSRFNPFRWRAHPARLNHSANSNRSPSSLMMSFFSFSKASSCRLAWVNDAWMAWLTSASGWMVAAGGASAVAATSNNRPNLLVLWNFWHVTLVVHMACVLAGRPVV